MICITIRLRSMSFRLRSKELWRDKSAGRRCRDK
jgi:hypothetical protein